VSGTFNHQPPAVSGQPSATNESVSHLLSIVPGTVSLH